MTIIQCAAHEKSGELSENQEPPPSGPLTQQAESYFCLKRWSQNTLHINQDGHLSLDVEGNTINLYQLAKNLMQQKQWPVLLRFPALITRNISAIQEAFIKAIKATGYQNEYTLAYPLKVNPHASVVKAMMQSKHADHMTFEVGSKAELVIALIHTTHNQRIMCNGFKDAGYISLVIEAANAGQKVCLVFETLGEVEQLVDVLEKQNRVLPADMFLGLRLRLSTPVDGHWEDSNGQHSKFGLSSMEAIQVINSLKKCQLLSHLKVMHIHPGSQILAINELSSCFKEAVRYYHELLKLKAPIEYVDIGGGLAMDYSGAAEEKLRDYTLDDYAMAIIAPMEKYCRENNLPQPHIFSETGRNTVALSSMLLTDVQPLGEINQLDSVKSLASSNSPFVRQLWELHHFISSFSHNIEYNEHNEQRQKHIEATQTQQAFLMDNIRQEFLSNQLSLSELANAEKVAEHNQISLKEPTSYQKYLANFSVFQSMPDYWGIQQFFPMLSLHGYENALTKSGVFYDLTCDSDGVVKHYLHPEKLHPALAMPNCDVEFVGIFLMGAYQEIMASGHNLFEKMPCLDITWDAKKESFETHLYESCDIGESLAVIGYNEENLVERSQAKFTPEMHALLKFNMGKHSYLERG